MSESDFEDLLSDQGFSSKADRKGPRTMAEMRRQEQARDADPLKLKVRAGWPHPPREAPGPERVRLSPVRSRRQQLLFGPGCAVGRGAGWLSAALET